MVTDVPRHRHILVVEDDPDTRRALCKLLTRAGYATEPAADGAEALDALRRGERPDLILLDLLMPRMDGWRFRREQQRDPALCDIPVVVFSGVGDGEAQVRALGAAAGLNKALDADNLLEELRRLLAPSVLIVEDAREVRRLAGVLLRQIGLAVLEAHDGAEALAAAARPQGRLDLLVADVVLPDGDGVELAEMLRLSRPGLPVLFISGSADPATAQRCRQTVGATFLPKPFTPSEFVGAVSTALAGAG